MIFWETFQMNPIDLKANLHRMMTGSCTCMTKTPEIGYHYVDCKYRQLNEILEYIEHLEWQLDYIAGDRPR